MATMSGAKKADKQAAAVVSLSLEDFEDDIAVTHLLARVSSLPGAGRPGQAPEPAAQPGNLSLSEVKQLLERFERCDKELAKLQHQVDIKAERLRREVAREEGGYEAQAGALARGWEAAQATFQDLEARSNALTQAATKIGNRLQNADLYQRRALEAIATINCLQEFAHARDPGDLPPLFHDDARLGEAVAMVGRLLVLAQELISSRERAGLGDAKPSSNVAPELGTIDHACEQLELYRGLLDNRVVSRFDTALTRQDLAAMAECATIMSQLSQGEAVLAQRYISTRPMFASVRELQAGGAGAVERQQAAAAAAAVAAGGEVGGSASTAAAGAAALKGLGLLYKGLLGTLRDEAVVMEQVFPSPYAALALFIQRVFEQQVHAAVDAALRPPGRDAGPAELQSYLRLLAEVYRRTLSLADDLQGLVGDTLIVRDLADMACAEPLEAYPELEMRWLSAAHDARLAAARAAGVQGLSMQAVLEALAANEEAVQRCLALSAPSQLAAATRQLFHSSTRKQASPGCLLEQVATHIIVGVGSAVEACTKHMLGPFRPHQLLDQAAAAAAAAAAPPAAPTGAVGRQQQPAAAAGAQRRAGAPSVPPPPPPAAAAPSAAPLPSSGPLSRVALQKAAQLAAAEGLGLVLQAVSTAGAIARVIQQHYQRVLAPHVASHTAESRACAAGLAAMVSAVDERVLTALQRCLLLLSTQLDATLVAAQQRSDFQPSEVEPPPSLDAPTGACLLACALLGAVVDQCRQHLHGSNLNSLLGEVARRSYRTLRAHMLRFSYSPMGALRWKRDVSEYSACLTRAGAGAAAAQFEELQALANLLVVAPESLLGLVDGNLRLSHGEALTYVQLRADFRSARVGDSTLAALFSAE